MLPQAPVRRPFSAWTLTSWPPEHGAALWGWLFPGPCSLVEGDAPWCRAIPPAVCPLPYSFVALDEAGARVSCAVSFAGFTPAVGAAFWSATVVVATVVVSAPAGGASFFTCPGALAELPGAPLLPLPFSLPFPLPASAEPANTKIPKTSTNVPVSRSRMVILPFPTSHVSEEAGFVQRICKREGRPPGRPSELSCVAGYAVTRVW